jgi:deoxycytidylate deaminase
MSIDRDYRWMHKAALVAENTPPCSGAKLGSCLVIKNRLISTGRNSYRTHPLALKYGKNTKALCIHCELDAIMRATKKIEDIEFKAATLYVCRVKYKSDKETDNYVWGLALPCSGCAGAIVAYNVGRVVYSLDSDDKRYGVIE